MRSRYLGTVFIFFFILFAVARLAQAQQPLATAETNWSGVALDVMTVERKGSVLTVKWAVRNHGPARIQVIFDLLSDHATTYAVDQEHGAKYYVLTDKEKHALASASEYTGSGTGISEAIEPGATKRYWMKLPAPPPQVKKITVFFSKTEPFEDLAITDK
ncbi:MAG TPA: hypothetical protein VHR45_00325 [Thermoanaerobaculia bacterium]|nr:hypothetical protein [Thermoanaerobaculia bacterium]